MGELRFSEPGVLAVHINVIWEAVLKSEQAVAERTRKSATQTEKQKR
jgi:hypothetical protein